MRFCERVRHPRDRLRLGRRVIDHFRLARDLASVNLTHEFSLPLYRLLHVMTCVICHFDAQIFSAFLSFVMSLGLCSLDFSLLFVFCHGGLSLLEFVFFDVCYVTLTQEFSLLFIVRYVTETSL